MSMHTGLAPATAQRQGIAAALAARRRDSRHFPALGLDTAPYLARAAAPAHAHAHLDLLANIDNLSEDNLPQLLAHLETRVYEQALDARGCRLVQRALELGGDKEHEFVLRELHGKVSACVESKHGNHVLQLAIDLARNTLVAFIPRELRWAGSVPAELAQHPFGCRVLERILEHFPLQNEDVAYFVDGIMAQAIDLCRHCYGNFVMQHLLEHGMNAHRHRIVKIVLGNLNQLVLNPCASGVLDKALTYASPGDQRELAAKVLNTKGSLVAIACQRSGSAPTQRLFKVLGAEEHERALAVLREGLGQLQLTKHGRVLWATMLPRGHAAHSHKGALPVWQ